MALWLDEGDVEAALDENAPEIVARLDRAYRSDQSWDSRSRTRFAVPSGSYQYMGAAVPSDNVMGLKTYAGRKGARSEGVVVLFDREGGSLLAVMSCDILGSWRTGAASAVATRHFARGAAVSFGLIGAGKQAMTQIGALAAACQVNSVLVCSRDAKKREVFCEEAEKRFAVRVRGTANAEEVAVSSNVITTVTPAREVVLRGSWIDHPCHINAVGANGPSQQELDSEVFSRADLVAVDNLEQARIECGDIANAVADGAIGWDDVVTLRVAMRQDMPKQEVGRSGVTIFESQGIAAWDLVVAKLAYSICRERGLGIEVPLRG